MALTFCYISGSPGIFCILQVLSTSLELCEEDYLTDFPDTCIVSASMRTQYTQ